MASGNKYCKPSSLKQDNLLPLSLEARSPESRCQQAWFLLRALRKCLFPVSLLSLPASGDYQQSLGLVGFRWVMSSLSLSLRGILSLCLQMTILLLGN